MSKQKPRSLFRARVHGKTMHLTPDLPGDTDGSPPKYLAKVEQLAREHGLNSSGGLRHVAVMHDDWCGIFEGKPCDCDPEVKLYPK